MPHTVYVAGHDVKLAFIVRNVLQELGFAVNSSWIDKPNVFDHRPRREADKKADANANVREITEADAFVLIGSDGEEKFSGGKFVEAGIAAGIGKPVVVIYGLENLPLRGDKFTQMIDAEQAGRYLLRHFGLDRAVA